MLGDWFPKSFLAVRTYDRHLFFSDLISGITVGLVALPLAMAFAIASNAPPQAGLYTAIVAGAAIAIFGGSKTQISGPTGAFVVVVAGIISRFGMDGLFLCTTIAGLMLLAGGLTGMGRAVQYIPRPVVLGFTNGIAVLIASTQIKDFFGLKIDKVPGDFWGRMEAVVRNFATLSKADTALAVIGLAVIILCARYLKRVPGYIVALFLATALVMSLHLPVVTIGSRFNGIPAGLPHLSLPHYRLSHVLPLMSSALTVALLGAMESLMSAVVADRMSGDKHNPNVELIGQGIGNLLTPLFGGLPATGAIARTATNIRSGGKTPVAGVIHALTLLLIVVFAAPLASYVPLAVLAAILMVVSYNMGEWKEIPKLLRLTKTDIWVWAITFLLTVFADLTIAVEVGMILAALLFIRRINETTTVSRVTHEYIQEGVAHVLQYKEIPDYVAIFRIHGPFLFGTTEKIESISHAIPDLPHVVIIRLRNMTALDATGALALESLSDDVIRSGRKIIFCGARPQPAKLITQGHLVEKVGEQNIRTSFQEALERAAEIYKEEGTAKMRAIGSHPGMLPAE